MSRFIFFPSTGDVKIVGFAITVSDKVNKKKNYEEPGLHRQ